MLERGERAGDDGYNRHNGATVHLAVDTLGQLLTRATPMSNWHSPGGGHAANCQVGGRLAAAALGGRAQVSLNDALPSPGT